MPEFASFLGPSSARPNLLFLSGFFLAHVSGLTPPLGSSCKAKNVICEHTHIYISTYEWPCATQARLRKHEQGHAKVMVVHAFMGQALMTPLGCIYICMYMCSCVLFHFFETGFSVMVFLPLDTHMPTSNLPMISPSDPAQ